MKSLITLSALIFFGTFSAYGQGQCTPPIAPPACVQSGGILSIVQLCEPRTRVVNGNVETYSCCQEFKTQCCAGLEIEKIGNDEACFKKDDSPLDTTLQSCTADNECSDGKGCFLQDPDDLFSGDTNSEAEEESQTLAREAMDDKIEAVLSALGEDAEEKANGQSCVYHAECASYNCVAKKSGNKYVKTCEDKKICRLAKVEEKANNPVLCEEGLIKDGSSTCREPQDGTYLGLLGDVEVQADSSNTCNMDIPADAKAQGLAAIKALRAMEFLFAKTSVANHDDCLRIIIPVIKDRIGTKLAEARKAEVTQFNNNWSLIKEDYHTLMSAQEADQQALSQTVQLHGAPISMDMIKSRTSTGFDMLIMMKRRNLLFMDYEKRMKVITKSALDEISALGSSMAGFDQNSKKWGYTTADGQRHDFHKVSCRPWLFPRKKMKVKKRWGQNFQVWGKKDGNKELADNTVFTSSLAQMADESEQAAKDAVTKRKYYLMDPLMPQAGDTRATFEDFGLRVSIRSKDRNRKLGNGGIWNNIFAGAIGGPIAWGILLSKPDADGGTTLMSIRNRMLLSYQNYLKEFNPAKKQSYLFEPELVALTNNQVTLKEESDCIFNKSNIDSAECAPMKTFIEDISYVTMAQFFAFSRTDGRHYKNYFSNEQSWRRRLFRYYEKHYANLIKYYEVLEDYRNKQNQCIDERLGLVSQTITEGGYYAGLANNYWDPSKYLGELSSGGPKAPVRSNTNLSVNHNFSGFTGDSKQFQNGGALKDNIASSGTNTTSGDFDSSASASFAANLKRMNDANKKNLSQSEFEKKSKDVMESIKAVALSTSGNGGAGVAGASSLSGKSSFGPGANGNQAASLGKDLKGEADKNGADKDKSSVTGAASGAGAIGAAGAGFNALGGISAGSSSGMGSADASGNGAGYQDPTGMSDEEKDRLMANYERTKSKYSPNENDSLFNVVSKAYVRNLDKVLTKKKKNLEAQESK